MVVTAKAVTLTGRGAPGRRHRRRTLPALADGAGRPFVTIAAGEVLLTAVAAGLAVGLSPYPAARHRCRRTQPRGGAARLPPPPPLGDLPQAPLVTEWHVEPLFVFGTAAGAPSSAAGSLPRTQPRPQP